MRPAEPWGAHHSGAPAMPKNTPLSEASPTPGADVVAPLSDIRDHAATQSNAPSSTQERGHFGATLGPITLYGGSCPVVKVDMGHLGPFGGRLGASCCCWPAGGRSRKDETS